MLRRSGILAILLTMLLAAPAAAATTVTLRVEGKDATIFEGPVRTDAKTIEEDGSHRCDGTAEANGGESSDPRPTATTALDDGARANGFSWDGTFSEFGSFRDYFVTRIAGDTQKADQGEYWGFARNFEAPPVGGCQQQVFVGDEVLWAYDFFGDDGNGGNKPRLRLSGPSVATVGGQGTFRVIEGPSGGGVSGAAVGEVERPGQPAQPDAIPSQPAGADGEVTLRFDQPGLHRIKATNSGAIRSNAIEVCVTGPKAPDCGPRTLLVPGAAGGALAAPTVSSPRRGARYRRGPRLIKGQVSAPAGLKGVSFSLRRSAGRRCSFFLARQELFSRLGRCRATRSVAVGSQPAFSYLLPRALGSGRYALEVTATDQAGRAAKKTVRFTVR